MIIYNDASIDFFLGCLIFYNLSSEKELYCYERRISTLCVEASTVS